MPELKIRRGDERGCPSRGVLWQEERIKWAKDEDRDAGGEKLAYDVPHFTNSRMLAACCFNTWIELFYGNGADLTEEETRPILLENQGDRMMASEALSSYASA